MENLIKKAQKGDKEAFIQAVTLYMPQLYKVAGTRLFSEEDIGDAIQEAILASFINLQSLRKPEYFRTWLVRILINQCNDIARQNSKVVCIGSYEEEGILTAASSEVFTNEEIESRMDFKHILKRLSPDYRTVIVLYYINGFNTREISEILNEKEGTVKSRLSRARELIKTHYRQLLEVQ